MERSENDTRIITVRDLFDYINKFAAKYGPTYLVSDALQKLLYIYDAARVRFVDLCKERYVQHVTFDVYLYKIVQGNNLLGDLALLGKTLSSLTKNNLSKPAPMRELL